MQSFGLIGDWRFFVKTILTTRRSAYRQHCKTFKKVSQVE